MKSGLWSYVALVSTLMGGCANPIPPSGGPVDSTPPRIVEVLPDTNAVNVSDGTVRLLFSEAIDARSLSQALTVSPQGDRPPEVEVRGRTAIIDLGDLRPNTTYVVTLDNALRDARGVALASPLTVAFATGPRLNRGVLAGRVADPQTGEAEAGVDLFAYAATDTLTALPSRPLYQTQSSTDGTFRFVYLGNGPFFVLAVRDENRNRRLDPGEAYGVPPRFALAPDSTGVSEPWLLARADTTAPRVERVRSYSTTRHALRLSEGVAAVSGAWQLTDTLGRPVPLLTRYLWSRVPQEVLFTTPPVERQPLVLTYGGIADSAGNVLTQGTERWTTAAARDTFGLRFEGFVPPDGRLAPGDSGLVRFSLPLPDTLRNAVVFAQRADSVRTPLALTPTGGTTYAFPVADSLTVVVRADTLTSDADEAVLFFRAATARDVGEIEGVVAAQDATRVVVEAWRNARRRATARPRPDGTFVISGLLAGSYTLRAFDDRDGDGRWDGGAPLPYRPAEPVRWVRDPVDVRARWANTLPDTLYFVDPPERDAPAAVPPDTL